MSFWGSTFNLVFGILLMCQGAILLGLLHEPFSPKSNITIISIVMLVFGSYSFGVWISLYLIKTGRIVIDYD